MEERIPCAAHGQMHGLVQIPDFDVTSWTMLCAWTEEFMMVICSLWPLLNRSIHPKKLEYFFKSSCHDCKP